MTRYVLRDGKMVEKGTGEPMIAPDRIGCPLIVSDIKPYKSVVSNQVIDGRAAQREDLKRNGCRLVDPSEWKVETCRTEKWAKILNKPHEPVKARGRDVPIPD